MLAQLQPDQLSWCIFHCQVVKMRHSTHCDPGSRLRVRRGQKSEETKPHNTVREADCQFGRSCGGPHWGTTREHAQQQRGERLNPLTRNDHDITLESGEHAVTFSCSKWSCFTDSDWNSQVGSQVPSRHSRETCKKRLSRETRSVVCGCHACFYPT